MLQTASLGNGEVKEVKDGLWNIWEISIEFHKNKLKISH